MFEHIVGNEPAKRYLENMVAKNSIAHSMLFAGAAGIGKSLFAEALAKAVLASGERSEQVIHKIETGNHPDIHIYRPEGKLAMHSINAMRQLSEEVWLPPYEAERKVFIVHDADRMLPYSANALLKTFEEPALDTIIILLSSAPELLLPTIMSRCRTLYFQRLTMAEISLLLQKQRQIPQEKASEIASLSQGSACQAFRLCDQGEAPLRKKTLDFLSQAHQVSYVTFVSIAKELAEMAESTASENQEAVKADLARNVSEKLTALQREAIDKEIEGFVALQLVNQADIIFGAILGWFRDLQLLAAHGSRTYLMHADRQDALQAALKGQKSVLTLDVVLKAVKEAKQSLSRSTSLSLCLENLFLKLLTR